MKYNLLLIGLLLLIFGNLEAQESDWELKREKDNLKVYTRNIAETGIKQLKLHTEMKTSLNSIIALFDDVPANSEWVYSSKLAKVTKMIAPHHMHYYSVSDFPWPLNDRDLLVDSIVKQDPDTKVVTSRSVALLEGYPEQEGIVRVTIFDAQWTLTPLPGGMVDIIYVVETDPGGNIPVFLTNMFIDRGPIATMRKMREMLQLPKYRDANIDFIEELDERNRVPELVVPNR